MVGLRLFVFDLTYAALAARLLTTLTDLYRAREICVDKFGASYVAVIRRPIQRLP
jgi:hypothetical protein